MITDDYYFWKFKNQFNYMIGQIVSLEINFMEECNHALRLHLMQTISGNAFRSLTLFKNALREIIYTLTNTLLEAKTPDAETRAKVLAIRKAAATTLPSNLPRMIDELKAMIKFYGLESSG